MLLLLAESRVLPPCGKNNTAPIEDETTWLHVPFEIVRFLHFSPYASFLQTLPLAVKRIVQIVKQWQVKYKTVANLLSSLFYPIALFDYLSFNYIIALRHPIAHTDDGGRVPCPMGLRAARMACVGMHN